MGARSIVGSLGSGRQGLHTPVAKHWQLIHDGEWMMPEQIPYLTIAAFAEKGI